MQRTVIQHWIAISTRDGRFVADPWATFPGLRHFVPVRALTEASAYRLSLSARRMLNVGEVHDHYIRTRDDSEVVVIRYRCLTKETRTAAGVFSKLYFSPCDQVQYLPLSPAPLPSDIGHPGRPIETPLYHRGYGVAAQYELTQPPPWLRDGSAIPLYPNGNDADMGPPPGLADEDDIPLSEDSEGEVRLVSRTIIRLPPAAEDGSAAPSHGDA